MAMLSNGIVVLPPKLFTFACHPVGGPIVPSGTLLRNTGLALVPHTGADATSCSFEPSALLKPPCATGESSGQNAVAVPAWLGAAFVEALAITSLLSVDADTDMQLNAASNC